MREAQDTGFSLRCLGIDPGSVHLGYGLIEQQFGKIRHCDDGCLNLPAKMIFPKRLQRIVEWFQAYLEEHQPHCIAMEEVFVGRYPSAAIKLGHVRGGIMALAMQKKIEIFEYAPRRIKQYLTGYGGAGKPQVGFMVQKLLGLKGLLRSVDQTDALAIGLTHLFNQRQSVGALAPWVTS